MENPELLVTGPYPDADMRALAQDYRLHLLWEAADRPTYLSRSPRRCGASPHAGTLARTPR